MRRVIIDKVAFVNPDSIKRGYPHENIEYIDISSVGTGHLIETKVVPLADAPSRAKRLVKDRDTILSTVRPNRRSFLFIKKPRENTVVSTGFAVLRAKKGTDSRYLYYAVTDQKFTDYLTLYAKGAAYPAVDTEIVKRGEIPYWPLEIQEKISAVLSVYDDLIENSAHRIQILEKMVQLIYREWFVNFRFPGHEEVKFVDSELGKIPKGWEVRKVGDILERVKRKKKIKKQDYRPDGTIPVVDQGRVFIGGYTNDTEALYSDNLPIIVFGDHTRILKYVDFPFACGADGTQLLKANTEKMPISLFYYVLKSIDLSDFAYSRHFKFLKDKKVLLPDGQTARSFVGAVDPIRDHIKCLLSRSDNLRRTRDLLLPKLISGELDVSDLDIVIIE